MFYHINRKLANIAPPNTITNLALMNANENDWEDLPDKEFKRMIITVFKQLEEDWQIV